MSLDQNPTYAAPDDWRAYSGVLSRRVFAFLIDYAIVLLLCIPAAVIVFFLGVITLGLGFFPLPGAVRHRRGALFRRIARRSLAGHTRHAGDGHRDGAHGRTANRFPVGDRAHRAFLGHQLGFDTFDSSGRPVYRALAPRSRLPARHRHGQNTLISKKATKTWLSKTVNTSSRS
ncbi:hypothetical protein AGR3A_Cc270039 [Agrobacterium tomkonis CFBP 6623]|uniref:RDD domain-containing protein n=1 Tax=Agrobacterium tomkonis CFBP 6623 TaxID=1183432 RepID=A0A1S7PNF0_9HYPH|nr:hypothetical protein AGR3A_Cc270039 [Agrobacterium tomkonis CFBP 6623]